MALRRRIFAALVVGEAATCTPTRTLPPMHSQLVLGLAASLLLTQLAAAQSAGILPDTGRTVVYASGQARQPTVLDRAALVLMLDAQGMTVEDATSRLATIERGVLDTLRRFNLPTRSVHRF